MNAKVISLLNEAIALLSGGQNFPATQSGVDAAAAQYLKENPDVANHIYFGKHPLEHWQIHGKHEGRKWPSMAPPVEDQRPQDEPSQPKHIEADAENFVMGDVSDPLIFGTDDKQKYARNFDAIAAQLGQAAALAYLMDCVQGGPSLYRSAWQSRGLSSTESARAINAHSYKGTKGKVIGDEYVFGGNPFSGEGGQRVKLPN